MIDSEAYCIDILTQSLAIQKSLSSLNKLVLENHLRTHVIEMMGGGSAEMQDKAITEMLALYELHSIRGK
jgi:DNA-binding FrmR family transcriptional regulator